VAQGQEAANPGHSTPTLEHSDRMDRLANGSFLKGWRTRPAGWRLRPRDRELCCRDDFSNAGSAEDKVCFGEAPNNTTHMRYQPRWLPRRLTPFNAAILNFPDARYCGA